MVSPGRGVSVAGPCIMKYVDPGPILSTALPGQLAAVGKNVNVLNCDQLEVPWLTSVKSMRADSKAIFPVLPTWYVICIPAPPQLCTLLKDAEKAANGVEVLVGEGVGVGGGSIYGRSDVSPSTSVLDDHTQQRSFDWVGC